MIKKLTIDITDEVALEAAFPALVKTETVIKKTIDRSLLRKLVNAHHAIGATVPGVHAYYAAEEEQKQETAGATAGIV